MTIFYVTLVSTFILSVISRMHPRFLKDKRPMLIIVIMIMAILVFVSGLRSNIGDTGDYKHLYTLVAEGQEMDKDAYEPGFILLFTLLTYISSDPQIMIFVTALITNVLNVWVLRQYSSLFELQIYMYIAAGYFLVTMNGIRQALAASIVFIATKFIVEGKFKHFLIICLLASTIHSSAVIMIPAYFIVRQEAWSKKIINILILSIIALIFIQPIMEIIFASAEGTKLGGYEDAVLGGTEGGASIIRTIIGAIPVVLAYIGREKLKAKWPESNIFINMSLLNLIFMAFAVYNWLFARFTFYFEPYNFILLPYIIGNVFNKKQKDLIYFLFVIFYFMFFYYENVIALGIVYRSNFF